MLGERRGGTQDVFWSICRSSAQVPEILGTLFRKARNVYCEQEEATWGQGASLDRGWGKGIQVGSQLPPLGSTDIHYLVPAARTFLISHLTWGLGRWAICARGERHVSAKLPDFSQRILTWCGQWLPCLTPHPCPQHSAWLVRWFQTGVLDPANRVAAFQSPEPQTFTWSGSLILFSLSSRCPAQAPPVSGGIVPWVREALSAPSQKEAGLRKVKLRPWTSSANQQCDLEQVSVPPQSLNPSSVKWGEQSPPLLCASPAVWWPLLPHGSKVQQNLACPIMEPFPAKPLPSSTSSILVGLARKLK